MKKSLGKKKSMSYSMKGGAGTPYVYEDVPLIANNPLIRIGIYGNGDTYNFNIPGETTGSFFSKKTTPSVSFSSFCELYQYYQTNYPLSCVHQTFEMKTGGKTLKAPSFMDILGFALILVETQDRFSTLNLEDSKLLSNIFLALLISATQKGPICVDQAGQLVINNEFKQMLLQAINKFFPLKMNEMIVPGINQLNEFQVTRILRFFKKALFYYRYNTLPSSASLTFESMADTDSAQRAFGAVSSLDYEKFKTDRLMSYFIHNSGLYREPALELALLTQSPGGAAAASMGGKYRRNKRMGTRMTKMRTRSTRMKTRRTKRRY